MRSVFSGSYSALNNQGGEGGGGGQNDVYRSTTRPSFDGGIPSQTRPEKFNVVNSMKRIFRGASSNYSGSGPLRASQSVFVLPNIHEDSVASQAHSAGINYDRVLRRDKVRRMPTSTSMEEAALLGCNPSESMDEVELKNIQLSFPTTRTLARGDSLASEERVDTNYGSILVGIQGDRSKPAILTYHDLGLNYVSNFQAFFNFVDMRLLLQNFCVYHVNAPGQEEGAPTLMETYVYPTMDELAEQLLDVLIHFGLKRVVGFGVGAGANILCRFALNHAEKVDALCVINCVSTQAGWIEWGYQKLNSRNLRSKGMTQGVLDYLMWHHFGRVTDDRNHDLVHVYRQYFEKNVNPINLGMFIDSYIRRTDLGIVRELDPIRRKDARTLKMTVLNVTGSLSPHVDDTVAFNGRLDPVNSTWMKIQDCGMVMEEQPAKLSEAFRLFLQGQGYALKLFRKNSLPEGPEFISTYRIAPNRSRASNRSRPLIVAGGFPISDNVKFSSSNLEFSIEAGGFYLEQYVPCLSKKKIALARKLSVDSGAGSSAGSCVSLNGAPTGKQSAGGGSGSGSSGIATPQAESSNLTLINLNGSEATSTKLMSGADLRALDKGLSDIRITENPISEKGMAAGKQVDPAC